MSMSMLSNIVELGLGQTQTYLISLYYLVYLVSLTTLTTPTFMFIHIIYFLIKQDRSIAYAVHSLDYHGL